ncbi:MAG: trypsin-like peptidase domain-containing protein [Nitrospirae bacterium]|nr:trypsin-like peptidase domain-containing protein [Nitrospirota bacterium]MBU6480688.1 trypsin-like peptidase domain-containing protein [Nitrospirota bacterium]MDE3041316.1 trypsin-like peptidase domain-containing protein [Nitrospirota bacterium]MDE3221315.1 trypsin-like peptidase domain-containing protein [Nitrospirota bacterium]
MSRQALLIGLISVTACTAGTFSVAAVRNDSEDEQTVGLYKRLAPATVFLSSVYTSDHPMLDPTATGVGAGFILDQDGTVLTNAHVVERASAITATLFDGRQVRMEVIGSDPETDLAVLRLPRDKGPYATVPLGDSDQLQVGQRALVVGSPFGLGFTLTSGIISGLGPLPGKRGLVDSRIIRTTAPINPGNSGGPLVDTQGRVVGISTATLVGAQNIGFAIPINKAKAVMAELKQRGRVSRPWLGVSGKFPTAEFISLFAMPLGQGFLVEDVEDGSPAADAGLRAGTLDIVVQGVPWILGGDIVMALDGSPIRTPGAFLDTMKGMLVGRTIEVEYLREGIRHRTALVVREHPPKTWKGTPPPGVPVAGARPFGFPPWGGGGFLQF